MCVDKDTGVCVCVRVCMCFVVVLSVCDYILPHAQSVDVNVSIGGKHQDIAVT